MPNDDWRLRIELGEEHAHGLLGLLGLVNTEADELTHDLRHARLAVTRDADTVFVYADSQSQLELARPAIDSALGSLEISPEEMVVEHWLDAEDRWDDEPRTATVEEETASHGFAPWEVRIPCRSHAEAKELADRLEADGYGVVRRWSYVIAGTDTREQAEELAARLHGVAEPGGEVVWEAVPSNPFAIFGGLGSSGTPF
jgi:hypothetical protein